MRAAAAPTILILGDSLSAAYGMSATAGWPDLLEQRLVAYGYAHRVINASISGDTTRGGLARLPAALDRYHPAVVIIALGGNDGLRGLPPSEMEQNLTAIIERSQRSGAKVLLAGVQIPPNYGPAYTERFRAIYPELAGRYGVPLVPFLLEGVALDRNLMQADGLHPKAEAQQIILDNVWPPLKTLLDTPATAAPIGELPANRPWRVAPPRNMKTVAPSPVPSRKRERFGSPSGRHVGLA